MGYSRDKFARTLVIMIEKLRQAASEQKLLPVDTRLNLLRKLKIALRRCEAELLAALSQDLGKSPEEAYATELAVIHAEIDLALRCLRDWARSRRVGTPLAFGLSRSQIMIKPKGVVLILGAWNYPVQLVLVPLVAALAAGNTVLVKPSEMAVASGEVISKLIAATFDPEQVQVVRGGPDVARQLLEEDFDHIFFTGSTNIGKSVMQAAARSLTPVTLELGGKSPCIVDREVDIRVVARRIVWGKFLNAGQTCVAPDFVIAHQDVYDALVVEMKRAILEFYSKDPQGSPAYARIINDHHWDRLNQLLIESKVVHGGQVDKATRFISPTLIEAGSFHDAVMQDEIFGPLLPVMLYRSQSTLIRDLRRFAHPLACYIFSMDNSFVKHCLERISCGGFCVNDVVVHVANPQLPFGGIRSSGMGRYHGEYGFREFSQEVPVHRSSLRFDVALRYPPYRVGVKWLRWLLG